MKIEITSEQFNLIQDEIIILEESLDNIDKMGAWQPIWIRDEISKLKEILSSEMIDLDKLT